MKALSIKQPWANMIAEGRKTIETRTWRTSYRGHLLICSSKNPRVEPAGCAMPAESLVAVRKELRSIELRLEGNAELAGVEREIRAEEEDHRNYYAETMAKRFWGERKFTDIQCHEDRLSQPLRWKKPRRVFVNSMSDLFHEDVPRRFIAEVFTTMIDARWHTYQVLTKRPERMLDWMQWATEWLLSSTTRVGSRTYDTIGAPLGFGGIAWPPPNVWLGVSVENQATADERIPLLLQTPAAVRFVSVEPMLGAVDLDCWPETGCPRAWIDDEPGLDWIICGGESGPGARDMDPDWARSLRDQCKAAGVAFFMKQMARKAEIPEDLMVREFPA